MGGFRRRGDAVRLVLIRREGFEGVAQGLTVYDRAGGLLLLYDDGGYGAAVVSREWTGPPMTDVDLSPLAYLVFRTDGS